MKKFYYKKARKGFTVVEVLIATMILVIVLTALIYTTRSAIRADQDALDYGLARSLAEEAVEMVRNVRDTNWLKYSAYPDHCWDYWLQSDNVDQLCNDTEDTIMHKFAPGFYTTHIDPDNKLIVLKGNDANEANPDSSYLDTDNDGLVDAADRDKFRLYKGEFATGTAEVFYINYANMSTDDSAEYTVVPASGQTKFFRSVWINHDWNNDNSEDVLTVDLDGNPATLEGYDKMRLVVRVWWGSGASEKSITLNTVLVNYEE